MPEQLVLLDLPEAPEPPGNWFFALRFEPDTALALRFHHLALTLRDEHGLAGRPLGIDRLHVSLHALKSSFVWQQDLIEKTCRAVADTEPPFEATFDQVASFGGHFGQHALVLRGIDSVTALRNFWRRLGIALTEAGLGRLGTGAFNPHVTLLYDHRTIAGHKVDAITWTVKEFYLVQSMVGESRHIVQGCWQLRG